MAYRQTKPNYKSSYTCLQLKLCLLTTSPELFQLEGPIFVKHDFDATLCGLLLHLKHVFDATLRDLLLHLKHVFDATLLDFLLHLKTCLWCYAAWSSVTLWRSSWTSMRCKMQHRFFFAFGCGKIRMTSKTRRPGGPSVLWARYTKHGKNPLKTEKNSKTHWENAELNHNFRFWPSKNTANTMMCCWLWFGAA